MLLTTNPPLPQTPTDSIANIAAANQENQNKRKENNLDGGE